MTSDQRTAAAGRLRIALDLFEAGERMMHQTLRRQHPNASSEEIKEKLGRWLQTRPGAEFGDAEGSPLPWPLPVDRTFR